MVARVCAHPSVAVEVGATVENRKSSFQIRLWTATLVAAAIFLAVGSIFLAVGGRVGEAGGGVRRGSLRPEPATRGGSMTARRGGRLHAAAATVTASTPVTLVSAAAVATRARPRPTPDWPIS